MLRKERVNASGARSAPTVPARRLAQTPGRRGFAGVPRSERAQKRLEELASFTERARTKRKMRAEFRALKEKEEEERLRKGVNFAKAMKTVRTFAAFRFLRRAFRAALFFFTLHVFICSVLALPEECFDRDYWGFQAAWWGEWASLLVTFPREDVPRFVYETWGYKASHPGDYLRRVLRRVLGRLWVTGPRDARAKVNLLVRGNGFWSYYLHRYVLDIKLRWGRRHVVYTYFRILGQVFWWLLKVFVALVFAWFLAFWYLEWLVLGDERGGGLGTVLYDHYFDYFALPFVLYVYNFPEFNFWIVDVAVVGVAWGVFFLGWRDRRSFRLVPDLPALLAAWVVCPGYYILVHCSGHSGVRGIYGNYTSWWYHQLYPRVDFFWWANLWDAAAASLVVFLGISCLARINSYRLLPSERRGAYRGELGVVRYRNFLEIRSRTQLSPHFFYPHRDYRDYEYLWPRESMRRSDWLFYPYMPDEQEFWQGLPVGRVARGVMERRGEAHLLDPVNFAPGEPIPPAPPEWPDRPSRLGRPAWWDRTGPNDDEPDYDLSSVWDYI